MQLSNKPQDKQSLGWTPQHMDSVLALLKYIITLSLFSST